MLYGPFINFTVSSWWVIYLAGCGIGDKNKWHALIYMCSPSGVHIVIFFIHVSIQLCVSSQYMFFSFVTHLFPLMSLQCLIIPLLHLDLLLLVSAPRGCMLIHLQRFSQHIFLLTSSLR